jgi:hypothetical protein
MAYLGLTGHVPTGVTLRQLVIGIVALTVPLLRIVRGDRPLWVWLWLVVSVAIVLSALWQLRRRRDLIARRAKQTRP